MYIPVFLNYIHILQYMLNNYLLLYHMFDTMNHTFYMLLVLLDLDTFVLHIHDMIRIPRSGALMRFLHLGNISVDIFLFLSAVGLSYSIEKNSLKEFYKNRFLRLWVPFLIICVPYYMWRDSVTGITLERVQCFFLDITAVNFWLKQKVPFWYISVATAMYLFYPLLYRLYRKNKNYIPLIGVICVITEIILMENGIFTHAEKALSRIPIILVGIYMSDIIKKNCEITKKQLVFHSVLFTVSLITYLILDPIVYVMYKRFIYAFMTVPMLVLIAYGMEKIKAYKLAIKISGYWLLTTKTIKINSSHL